MSQTESGAAEQMVGFGIRMLDSIARLMGDGAKNLAAFTAASIQNKRAEKGKSTFSRMIRDGKEMKVFQIPDDKKRQFARQCKKYGVLFAAVRDKKLMGKQLDIFKQAAGKTAKSILISVGVHLAAFNLPEIAAITNYDEMDISGMGERKVALFCCIPDNDTSLNFLVGMLYTQAFQELYYSADRVHNGRLPIPVHAVMDEFPNISIPDDFDKLLATMRSRCISVSIIIQNIAQLKALFKDSHESIVGNCDEFLYLGGNEQGTHKLISEMLGKSTIDTNTYGQTKGKSGSFSTNFQNAGRELLTPDEVRLMDNKNALLFIRGERPVLDEKYDILKHPHVASTPDGGGALFLHTETPLAVQDISIDLSRLEDYEIIDGESILAEEAEEQEAAQRAASSRLSKKPPTRVVFWYNRGGDKHVRKDSGRPPTTGSCGHVQPCPRRPFAAQDRQSYRFFLRV